MATKSIKRFIDGGTKKVPYYWIQKAQKGSLMVVLKRFFISRPKEYKKVPL